MDFEAYEVKEDGTEIQVGLDKINDLLSSKKVAILVDHIRRKIFNYNGRESSIRARFCGARLAAGPIRHNLGLSYGLASIDEGEESEDFRTLVKNLSVAGNSPVPAMVEIPPARPPQLKTLKQKEVAVPPKLPPLQYEEVMVRSRSTPSDRTESRSPSKADTPIDADVTSVISQFGEVPTGSNVEAIIIDNAIYKYVSVKTEIFGKGVDQSRLERVTDLNGVFTMDGQVKVITKNGNVAGIQILSKAKAVAAKKAK